METVQTLHSSHETFGLLPAFRPFSQKDEANQHQLIVMYTEQEGHG